MLDVRHLRSTTTSAISDRVGLCLSADIRCQDQHPWWSGYYYQAPNGVSFQDVVGIPPFAPIVNITNTNFTNPYSAAGVADPFPGSFGPIDPGPSATFPQDISFTQIFDRHFRLPQILSYNLTLEREFAANWFARLEYVGNLGSHLGGTGDQESGLLQLNPSVYIPGQSTEDNIQQRRLYPNFGFIGSINSGVNSNYNAGQIEVEKRLSYGLSFQTNYTWSHALNNFGPNGQEYLFGIGGINTCGCGRSLDYGPDAGDATNVFRLSGMYAFPHLPVKGITDKAVNGWNLSFITNWQSGFPFTAFAEDDNSFSAMGNDRPDITVANISATKLSTTRSHAALGQRVVQHRGFCPQCHRHLRKHRQECYARSETFHHGLSTAQNRKGRGTGLVPISSGVLQRLQQCEFWQSRFRTPRQQFRTDLLCRRSSDSADGAETEVLTNL